MNIIQLSLELSGLMLISFAIFSVYLVKSK